LIFPLLYALLLYRFLPGGPVLKGATMGIVLWLIAQTMIMPMMGGGWFSSQMGGMTAAIASLAGHLNLWQPAGLDRRHRQFFKDCRSPAGCIEKGSKKLISERTIPGSATLPAPREVSSEQVLRP
jgi:hypothetical protein